MPLFRELAGLVCFSDDDDSTIWSKFLVSVTIWHSLVSGKVLVYSVVSGKNLEHPVHPRLGGVLFSGKISIVGNFQLSITTGSN